MVVGPYQSKSLYRVRRHQWLIRAVGLAAFYPHVFLILPGEADSTAYTSWVEAASRLPTSRLGEKKRVHVISTAPSTDDVA
jgi:hypothetical protein